MNKDKLMDYVIASLEKQGAEDVIVNHATEDHTQLKFYNNKISPITKWKNEGLSIFCVIDKKIISTSLKDLNEESADKIIKKILAFSKEIVKNDEYLGIADGPFKHKNVSLFDKKLAEIDKGSVDIIKEALDIVNTTQMRCSGVLEISTVDHSIKTNHKVDAKEASTTAYFSIRSMLDQDASGHMVSCSRTLKDLDYQYAAEESARIARDARSPKEGSSGVYDVLFYPLAAANIIEQAGDQTSIFSVESGLSCYTDKLNKKIANTNLTLYDDGTIPEGLGTSAFDSEGVPTRRTPLIEKGILKNYLHNTSTAKKYKTQTTANAGLISPSPHNLIVLEGKSSRQDMIRSMKKGLIITNLWYTRFQNHATGDFSTIPRDGVFLVENGIIKNPVHSIRISDNLLNILSNLSSTGNKSRQIHGWEVETPTFTPDLLFKDVKITKPM